MLLGRNWLQIASNLLQKYQTSAKIPHGSHGMSSFACSRLVPVLFPSCSRLVPRYVDIWGRKLGCIVYLIIEARSHQGASFCNAFATIVLTWFEHIWNGSNMWFILVHTLSRLFIFIFWSLFNSFHFLIYSICNQSPLVSLCHFGATRFIAALNGLHVQLRPAILHWRTDSDSLGTSWDPPRWHLLNQLNYVELVAGCRECLWTFQQLPLAAGRPSHGWSALANLRLSQVWTR